MYICTPDNVASISQKYPEHYILSTFFSNTGEDIDYILLQVERALKEFSITRIHITYHVSIQSINLIEAINGRFQEVEVVNVSIE